MKTSKRRFAFFQAIAFSLAALFLVACGDDNPLTAAAEKEESYVQRNAAYCRNNGGTWDSWRNECSYRSSSSGYCTYSLYGVCYDSEYNRCLNNGGRWDSYYYECDYGYYSSSYRSSSSAYYYTPTTYAYTTSQKTMRLTTTYYRQTASNWDILDNAGDPEISYKVTFKKKDSTTTYSWTTSYYIGEDYRSWSGSFYRELTVPANTYSINVRPSVIDRDVSSNDDRSSGYSVTWPAVGYMRNYETVKDTDDYGGYTLRYEWYLY